jgi:hypothetical protein
MASPVEPQSIVVAVTGSVAVAPFIVIAVLNVRFASRGWTPLAQLVTAYLSRYPVFAALVAGFLGALMGHVFWSTGGPGDSRPLAPLFVLPAALGLTVLAGLAGAIALTVVAILIDPALARFGALWRRFRRRSEHAPETAAGTMTGRE